MKDSNEKRRINAVGESVVGRVSLGVGSGTSVMITMSVCGAYFSAAQYYAGALLSTATLSTVAPFVAAAVALTAGWGRVVF